jgi:hypothetical protein
VSNPKVCDRCGDAMCPMRWTGDRDKAFLLSIAVCNSNRIAAAIERTSLTLERINVAINDVSINVGS